MDVGHMRGRGGYLPVVEDMSTRYVSNCLVSRGLCCQLV